jgi:hypothetical protein
MMLIYFQPNVKRKEVGRKKGGLSRRGNRIGLFENGVLWKAVVLSWETVTKIVAD